MIAALAFSALAVVAAGLAIAFSDTRKVILSAWVASMSVGALFLCYGAEYLALVQWITGTLVAISSLVYASLFGEYGPTDTRSTHDRVFDLIPAVLVGGAFFGMVVYGSYGMSEPSAQSGTSDLVSVGQALADRHIVSLELLGFMLLAVLIGAGVISRPTSTDGDEIK